MSSPVGFLRGGAYPIPMLPGTRFTFGRSRQCSVHLKDGMVSRQHATITCDDDGKVLLEDLGSSNKTFLNNEAIDAQKMIELSHGDEVRMGGTLFRLKMITEKLDIDAEDIEWPKSTPPANINPHATEILTPVQESPAEPIPDEMRQAIEKAAASQRKMLPKLPQVPGMQFDVLYKPLERLSGDFYDFFEVSENELAIVVGDVSGHGIGAALAMSMIKKCLKIHGQRLGSPGETLRVTNSDIHGELERGTFCTIFYGLLNTQDRKLTFARAGHSPLILYNANREPQLAVVETKGLAVGIDKGKAFNRVLEEKELPLQDGDVLLQYTDGLVESANKKGEEFGMERICHAVERYSAHEAKHLLQMLEVSLGEHCDGVPIDDDLTLFCLKVG